jgi:hypothetical protein
MSFIHYIKSLNTLKRDFINTNDEDFKKHNMKSKITRWLNVELIMNKYLLETESKDFSYDEREDKYNVLSILMLPNMNIFIICKN